MPMGFTDEQLEVALVAASEGRELASPAEVKFHLPGAESIDEVIERLAAVPWADVFIAEAGWTTAPAGAGGRVERVRRRPPS
jgi:hypothetical protein